MGVACVHIHFRAFQLRAAYIYTLLRTLLLNRADLARLALYFHVPDLVCPAETHEVSKDSGPKIC